MINKMNEKRKRKGNTRKYLLIFSGLLNVFKPFLKVVTPTTNHYINGFLYKYKKFGADKILVCIYDSCIL
ncbi:MAG: hypothetical protein A2W90_20815 [Bacteroidetes bacterium GWF2_42_66]|nr:MAG: hypothetical protein A2W92_12510 [Bacteroidetes bacterium GWA2_42_15]OFX99184.1 MAG: hypothetical protein A2W89_03495 [Bacteroidetes bacterium GWE2_42_39]OFY40580.1 MAG: hypothetical protein A2W90_20815 [Bacteroidetes bacterium GWF2_42_66]